MNTYTIGQYDINNIKAGNHATHISIIVKVVIFIISYRKLSFSPSTNFKQFNQMQCVIG